LIDTSVLGAKVDHPDKSRQLLPKSAFGFPTLDQPTGNLGRNVFRKDGIFNVNVGLSRRFPLKGDVALQFSVESLNFLNHAQFEEPGLSLTEDNFGEITNTLNDGRSFQFTLNLAF
jgi:hypothetical protein